MAVSAELRDLVRGAASGMTVLEVVERTGLSTTTYERLRRGYVVTDKILVQFAVGLGIDPKPFRDAANRTRPRPTTEFDMMDNFLEMTGLTPRSRVEMMQLYRKLMERDRRDAAKPSAA